MNADNQEAERTDELKAPTAAAELYIVLKPANVAGDAPLGAGSHAIRPWGTPHLLPRRGRDRSHGRTADAPGDAVLAAFYLAAEQNPHPDEPSYHVDRGLQRFSAWLDDQIEP